MSILQMGKPKATQWTSRTSYFVRGPLALAGGGGGDGAPRVLREWPFSRFMQALLQPAASVASERTRAVRGNAHVPPPSTVQSGKAASQDEALCEVSRHCVSVEKLGVFLCANFGALLASV